MSIREPEAFSYCPKCGKKQTEHNSPLRCTQCNFIHYFSPKPGVKGIIITPSGKIVLTRRNIHPYFGSLDLVGGFIEPMETFEEGLLREAHEELGVPLVVKSMEYYGSFATPYIFHDILYSVLVPVFIVTLLEEIPLDQFDQNEIQEILLLDPEKVPIDEIGPKDYLGFLEKFIRKN